MTTDGHDWTGMLTNVVVANDADLWFEDGSIVVVTGDTGFRVHRSLLSRLSPIFRDAFAIPQPTAHNECGFVQGVPVIHVSDSSYDMKCMLRAIYDGPNYLADMKPYIPFEVLSALMRLGHKYEIISLVESAARCMGEHFNTDFRSWIDSCYLGRPNTFRWRDKEAALLEVVHLARLTGKTALLPTALYSLCQLDVAFLLKAGDSSDANAPGRIINSISREDIERCLRASDRLLRESASLVGVLASVVSAASSCTSHGLCTYQTRALFQAVAGETPSYLTTGVFSPLEDRVGEGPPRNFWGRLCTACRDALAIKYQIAQRKIWGRLPEILELSCDELGINWSSPDAKCRTEVV